jgi:hypothetical protein
MPFPLPALCQAGPSCPHAVCFAARLYRKLAGGHDQDVRTLVCCAHHLPDIVQALTELDSPGGGKVTVLAVDPTAWQPSDPAQPAAGRIPASLAFTTLQLAS